LIKKLQNIEKDTVVKNVNLPEENVKLKKY
jgi:hypothetical protein